MADKQKSAGLGPNRFEAVVFDLDGTLLDTLADLVLLTNSTLAEFGFPERTADEIHSFVGNGVRPRFPRALRVRRWMRSWTGGSRCTAYWETS